MMVFQLTIGEWRPRLQDISWLMRILNGVIAREVNVEVHAGMAKTPETPDHTSVKKRCEEPVESKQPNHLNQQEKLLYPFVGNPKQS